MAKKKIIPGQAGGKATLEKYGPDYFSKMASKAHARRKRLARLAQKGSLSTKKR